MAKIKKSENRKKVLLALPLPPPYCGSEKMAGIILNSVIIKRFDCIHIDTSNNQTSNEDRGSLKWVNISSTVRITWKIFQVLLHQRIDLINIPLACNTLGFLKYLCNLLPCLILRIKIVSRLGASHFDKFYEGQTRFYKFLIRWTLKHVDCIIVRGKLQHHQLDGIYNGRVECVYAPSTGVNQDVREKDYELKAKKQINVLYLGLISRAKGAFDLLKAIPDIVVQDERFRFHFVGDLVRKERNIMFMNKNAIDIGKFIKENSLEPFVTFYGRLEGEHKERKLKEADLFVFPSYSEGSPFAVIEAMEHGIPVIASRAGNLPELFENQKNILFVDFKSPLQIKDAILQTYNNPEMCRNMVFNNFKILEEALSLKDYEKKMIELFESIID